MREETASTGASFIADLSALTDATRIARGAGVERIELCERTASRIHASLAGIDRLSRLLAADLAEECFDDRRFRLGCEEVRGELLGAISALADYCGEDISNAIEREQRRARAA